MAVAKAQFISDLRHGERAIGQAMLHKLYFVLSDIMLEAFTGKLSEILST